MTAAVIVAHHERGEAAALAASAARWLRERDIDVWMPRADAAAIDLDELGDDRPAGQADLAISLGGDGTMLRTVELVGGARTTILGVNVGQLGYLTEVEPAALTSALERYVTGAYEVEERMMLAVDADPVGEAPPQSWRGAERGRHRAAGIRPHRPPPRAHRRRPLHELRRRRADRGHPHGLDGLLALGARPGDLAPAPCPPAHAGLASHAVRPRARARPRRVHRDRGRRTPQRRPQRRRAAGAHARAGQHHPRRCRSRAGALRALRTRRFHQILKAKFGLADR